MRRSNLDALKIGGAIIAADLVADAVEDATQDHTRVVIIDGQPVVIQENCPQHQHEHHHSGAVAAVAAAAILAPDWD